MSRVRLVTVPALALGDLLLWHWSLAGSHDVFAMISGLTLLPLLIASAWLLVVALVRALARGARRPRGRAARAARLSAKFAAVAPAAPAAQAARIATPAAGRDASSRKIAA